MAGFIPGQRVRLTATCRNLAGNLENTTNPVFKVKDAEGNQTEYAAPTNDSTGVYHQDLTITKAANGNGGTWHVRFTGEGNLIVAQETTFPVEQSAF